MMPRKFKLPKKRFDVLSNDQKEKLFFNFDFGVRVFLNDEDARACWQQFRQELMEEWFENEPAGTRPWAWWQFDSVGERRRLGGVGTPARDRSDCPEWARKVSYGMPGVFADDYSAADPPRFESEADYLKRNRLLTREEVEALARGEDEAS
jgi:hypothetical protein